MRMNSKAMVAGVAVMGMAGLAIEAQAATYGCFKVTADSLNIRARPYSSSEVLTSASKGTILEKRKYFCTPRGFWCAVRKGSVEGYADKSFMEKVPCP